VCLRLPAYSASAKVICFIIEKLGDWCPGILPNQEVFFRISLGFQFGFFYYREIYRYITEADYDAAVECALAEFFPDVQRVAFNRTYALAKHEEIGRLERRKIFTCGVVESC
ncbi:hypothetical protein WCE04_27315, partial [Pseudomonas shirazica]